jgi:energy-coupling factor transporter ATP-binding protein EcfA2
MRILSVSAHNVKNLELSNVPFRELTLVHGSNGIGKSNLLLLLHSLLSEKGSPPELKGQIKFPIEGVLNDPDFLRRTCGAGTAVLTLSCHSKKYRGMAKKFSRFRRSSPSQIPHEVGLAFGLHEYAGGVRFTLDSLRIGTRPIYGEGAAAIDAGQQKALEDWFVDEVVGSTIYVPANRIHRRDLVPLQLTQGEARVDNLENTVLRFLTSRDEDSQTLERVKKSLKDFFKIQDIRSEIRTEPSSPAPGEPELRVGIRLQEISGQWFDLERMGTGIQQVLVIVCLIHMNDAKIALVEEFDTSLSPGKRSQLLQQLTELLGADKPLRQVIATSHTTFKPRQPNIVSLGAKRPASLTTDFRMWNKGDWDRFLAGDE